MVPLLVLSIQMIPITPWAEITAGALESRPLLRAVILLEVAPRPYLDKKCIISRLLNQQNCSSLQTQVTIHASKLTSYAKVTLRVL